MLTREEWTRGPGTPPVVKGLIRFTDESRKMEGTGAGEEITEFLKECKLQFFRPKYMTSWPVFINFKQMLRQRNTLVLALKVRRL
jgi:hypothetical protein